VTVVDVDQARRPLAEALGAGFAGPAEAPAEADVVFHASASAAGLDTAIGCAGQEATVIEMSWYGDTPVKVGLGGAFHSRRLKLVSSQVGQVSPGRRPRWDYRRRMDAALRLLDQPALDLLVAEEIAFEDAPRALPRILAAGAHGLAPVIRYPQL
jgi:threonine dehydrogenase-like Zn-dependent dehydrogenase